MRLFFTIIATSFLVTSILLGFSVITNNLNQDNNNIENADQELKIITIIIKIKDNLPIRKELNLKTKYYFRLINKKVSLISLINKLNFATEKFNILEQNLTLEINSNYTLVLNPKRIALQIYNRNSITFNALINIGLKPEVVTEVINNFRDLNLGSEDLENKLKIILPGRKRKFLKIIKEFVIF